MSVVLIVCFTLLFCYSSSLFWLSIEETEVKKVFLPKENLSASIIIPFRNEELELIHCLSSILAQKDIKQHQVILIDDHSSDHSLSIAKKFNEEHGDPWTILKNESHEIGKKAALLKGISKAQNPIIITCDSDCSYSDQWLTKTMNELIHSETKLLCGNVVFPSPRNLFETLIYSEQILLQELTRLSILKGKPLMCNGANLAFYKDDFIKLGAYESHMHIASGDDFFLLESYILNKKVIKYNNDRSSYALSPYPSSLKAFIKQRIRWANKASSTKLYHVKTFGLLTLMINAFALLWLLLSFFYPLCLLFLFIKSITELLFALKAGTNLKQALFLSFLYPFYSTAIPLLGLFYKVGWKGRK